MIVPELPREKIFYRAVCSECAWTGHRVNTQIAAANEAIDHNHNDTAIRVEKKDT